MCSTCPTSTYRHSRNWIRGSTIKPASGTWSTVVRGLHQIYQLFVEMKKKFVNASPTNVLCRVPTSVIHTTPRTSFYKNKIPLCGTNSWAKGKGWMGEGRVDRGTFNISQKLNSLWIIIVDIANDLDNIQLRQSLVIKSIMVFRTTFCLFEVLDFSPKFNVKQGLRILSSKSLWNSSRNLWKK